MEAIMKRSLAMFIGCGLSVVPAAADIPVIDKTNYKVARETADTTSKILDTNKDILTTVEETLKAVTGDRGGEAGSLKDLAIGNGFSVSSVPSFDNLLQNGIPDFGSVNGEVAQAVTLFINGLQLVKSLSGKENSSLASDKSYEELMRTVLGVSCADHWLAAVGGNAAWRTRERGTEHRAGQRHQGLDRPEHATSSSDGPDAQ